MEIINRKQYADRVLGYLGKGSSFDASCQQAFF